MIKNKRGHNLGRRGACKSGPEARVVAVFSTVPNEVLFGIFEARRRKAILPDLAYSGDDPDAKAGPPGCSAT
jgi:hypothetical protein